MSTRENSTSLTPLMRAAAIGHVSRVKELIEEGADINQRGPRKSTALMFAAGGGHLDVVQALVEEGADLEAVEDGGWNAQMHAEADGHDDIVNLLSSLSAKSAGDSNFRRTSTYGRF